jgi:hypothetical protein
VSAGVAEHDVSLKTNLVTNEKNNKICVIQMVILIMKATIPERAAALK